MVTTQVDNETTTPSNLARQTFATRDATSARSPQLTTTQLRARAAGVRDDARILGEDAEQIHRKVQDYDLAERATLKARLGAPDLLTELAEVHGLGWNDIAVGAGVSLSAVRKWRRGGTCLPENRMALARLVALIDLAEEAMIVDAAGWLLTPVLDGYDIRHLDLIAASRPELVLDSAFNRKTGREVLDEFDPDWRENARREFDVVVDGDGVRSLKRLGSE